MKHLILILTIPALTFNCFAQLGSGQGSFGTIGAGSGGTNSYTLPVASASTLGGVKVGSGLAIDGSGVLTATNSGGSSSSTNGMVWVNQTWSNGGRWTNNTGYTVGIVAAGQFRWGFLNGVYVQSEALEITTGADAKTNRVGGQYESNANGEQTITNSFPLCNLLPGESVFFTN